MCVPLLIAKVEFWEEEDGGGWRRMEEDGGGWRRMEEHNNNNDEPRRRRASQSHGTIDSPVTRHFDMVSQIIATNRNSVHFLRNRHCETDQSSKLSYFFSAA